MQSSVPPIAVLQPDAQAAATLHDQILQHFNGELTRSKDVSETTAKAFQILIADGGIFSREKILARVAKAILETGTASAT
jgi:hypothetical protein